MAFRTPRNPFDIAAQLFGNAVDSTNQNFQRNQENEQNLALRDEDLARQERTRDEDRDFALQDSAYQLRLKKTEQIQNVMSQLPPDSPLKSELEKALTTLNNMGSMSGRDQLDNLPRLSVARQKILEQTSDPDQTGGTPPTTSQTVEVTNVPVEVLLGQAQQEANQYALALKEADEAQSYERQLDFLKNQGLQEQDLIAVRNITAKDYATFEDALQNANVDKAFANQKEFEAYATELWKSKQLFNTELNREDAATNFYATQWQDFTRNLNSGAYSEAQARAKLESFTSSDTPDYIRNAAIALTNTTLRTGEPLIPANVQAGVKAELSSAQANATILQERAAVSKEEYATMIEEQQARVNLLNEQIVKAESENAVIDEALSLELSQATEQLNSMKLANSYDERTLATRVAAADKNLKLLELEIDSRELGLEVGGVELDRLRIAKDADEIALGWARTQATFANFNEPRTQVQKFVETGNYPAIQEMIAILANPSLNPEVAASLAAANVNQVELQKLLDVAVQVDENAGSQREYINWQIEQAYRDQEFTDANSKLSLMQNMAQVYSPEELSSIFSGEDTSTNFPLAARLFSDTDKQAMRTLSQLNKSVQQLGLDQGYSDLENSRLQGAVTRMNSQLSLFASAPANGDMASALSSLESTLMDSVNSGLLKQSQVQGLLTIYRQSWARQNQSADLDVRATEADIGYRMALRASTLATAWETGGNNRSGGITNVTSNNGFPEIGGTEWNRTYGEMIATAQSNRETAYDNWNKCILDRSKGSGSDCSGLKAAYDLANQEYLNTVDMGMRSQNSDSTGITPITMNDGTPKNNEERRKEITDWMASSEEFQNTFNAQIAGMEAEEAQLLLEETIALFANSEDTFIADTYGTAPSFMGGTVTGGGWGIPDPVAPVPPVDPATNEPVPTSATPTQQPAQAAGTSINQQAVNNALAPVLQPIQTALENQIASSNQGIRNVAANAQQLNFNDILGMGAINNTVAGITGVNVGRTMQDHFERTGVR